LHSINFQTWSVEDIKLFMDRIRQELHEREVRAEQAPLDEEAALSALKVSFSRFQKEKKKQTECIESLFR